MIGTSFLATQSMVFDDILAGLFSPGPETGGFQTGGSLPPFLGATKSWEENAKRFTKSWADGTKIPSLWCQWLLSLSWKLSIWTPFWWSELMNIFANCYCWWWKEMRQENQLMLVVYVTVYKVLYITGGGFPDCWTINSIRHTMGLVKL